MESAYKLLKYYMSKYSKCFVFQDFGDYSDSYYSVQTQEGEQISRLIAGYIDIILKKVGQSCLANLD